MERDIGELQAKAETAEKNITKLWENVNDIQKWRWKTVGMATVLSIVVNAIWIVAFEIIKRLV